MFQRKSKPEQVRDSAIDAKDKAVSSVGTVAGSVLHAVMDAFDEKVAPKVEAAAETASSKTADVRQSARERGSDLAHQAKDKSSDLTSAAKEKATHARDRAVSGIDHGIDAAVPRGQEAVAAVGPKVDHARDVLVDDLLPRISEFLGNFQDAKNDVLSNKSAPLATLTGAPKKKSRKGGALILFGVAAAVGAAVAYYLNSQKKPATDPWATDHHVGGAPGVDAQVRATLADKQTATKGADSLSTGATNSGTESTGTKSTSTKSTSTTGAGAAGAATTGAGTTSTSTPAAPKASDTPIADSLSSKASSASDRASTDLDGGAASTRMLSGDEIDQLATDVPDDEIPGTSGSATSGFGTDFGDVDRAAKDNVRDAAKDATHRETDLP